MEQAKFDHWVGMTEVEERVKERPANIRDNKKRGEWAESVFGGLTRPFLFNTEAAPPLRLREWSCDPGLTVIALLAPEAAVDQGWTQSTWNPAALDSIAQLEMRCGRAVLPHSTRVERHIP